MSYIVTAQIFSGRKNPCWHLNEKDSRQFAELYAELLHTKDSLPLSNTMGYRGIEILSVAEQSEVHVFEGLVRWRLEQRLDIDRKLEIWLLETGKCFIHPRIFRLIKSEIYGMR